MQLLEVIKHLASDTERNLRVVVRTEDGSMHKIEEIEVECPDGIEEPGFGEARIVISVSHSRREEFYAG